MNISGILEGLWAGRIVAPPSQDNGFLELVRSLFPVHATCLVDTSPVDDKIVVMSDGDHVLADLPLSDVLALELDIFIPDRSLVFIVPASLLDGTASTLVQSKALGAAAAMAVVQTTEHGPIEVKRELRLIGALARACADLSVTKRLRKSRIFGEAFRNAFGTELEGLIGRPVMAQLHAAGEPGSEATHSLLFDYIETLIARNRRVDCNLFAGMAVHLGAHDTDRVAARVAFG